MRGLLSDHGILALNFVAFSQRGQNAALASVGRTIAMFPHHSIFISEPGKDFNDFIFLAAGRPIDLNSPTLRAEQVAWLKNRIVAVNETQGVTLTDKFNPLEQLQTRKAEYYRDVIVNWYGTDLLVR